MQVDVEESQAARFAIMQYAAMLRRVPEGDLVEKFNNNEAIIVGGSGRIPFPNAEYFVQENHLSFGFTPVSGAAGVEGSSPVKIQPPKFPTSGKSEKQQQDPSAAIAREGKVTIPLLESLLRSIGSPTNECVTTNDYAVRMYQVLDRQFDLTAEISGAIVKVRRPFGTPFPAVVEEKTRRKIKGKLSALDGNPASVADAQKTITKLQDRIDDLNETINRLRGVKTEMATLQTKARGIRDSCATTKQAVRFQFLDMQDFLQDQLTRFKGIVGADTLRTTGVSTAGTMNAAKKAALDDQIRTMKEQNPLRDAASVLRMTLSQTLNELSGVLKAPLDPSLPVDDSDDEEQSKPKKTKKKKPNCVAHLLKTDAFKSLPKVSLVGKDWEILKTYDKSGIELDLLKNAIASLGYMQQMQSIVGRWYLENTETTAQMSKLRMELQSSNEELELTKRQLENALASAQEDTKGGSSPKGRKASKVALDEPDSPKLPPSKAAAAPSKTPAPVGKKAEQPAMAKKGSFAKPAAKPSKLSAGGHAPAVAVTDIPTALPENSSSANEVSRSQEQSVAMLETTMPLTADTDDVVAVTAGVVTLAELPSARDDQPQLPSSGEMVNTVAVNVEPWSTLPPPPRQSPPRSASNERPFTAQSNVSDAPSLSTMIARQSLPPLMTSLDSITESINATKSGGGGGGGGGSISGGRQTSKSSSTKPTTSAKTINKKKPNSDGDVGTITPVKTVSPTPSTDATPRPVSFRSSDDDEQQQQQQQQRSMVLNDSQIVLLHTIFLELASVGGFPPRMHRLLIELFRILFPTEPILLGLVTAAEQAVLHRIAAPLRTPPSETPLLLPLSNAQVNDMSAIDMTTTSTVVNNEAASDVVVPRQDSLQDTPQRRKSLVRFGSIQSRDGGEAAHVAKTSSSELLTGTPPSTRVAAGKIPQPQQLQSVISNAPSSPPFAATEPIGSLNAGSSKNLSQTASLGSLVSALPAAQRASVVSNGGNNLLPPLQPNVSGGGGGGSTTSGIAARDTTSVRARIGDDVVGEDDEDEYSSYAIKGSFAISAAQQQLQQHGYASTPPPSSNPLSQIRQLRLQYSTSVTPVRRSLADQIDPSELDEADAAFAKRKHKFLELTRKLLSDLPVLRDTSHTGLPVAQTDGGASNSNTKHLVFAPVRQFPTK